jgi:hypothetical protein
MVIYVMTLRHYQNWLLINRNIRRLIGSMFYFYTSSSHFLLLRNYLIRSSLTSKLGALVPIFWKWRRKASDDFLLNHQPLMIGEGLRSVVIANSAWSGSLEGRVKR